MNVLYEIKHGLSSKSFTAPVLYSMWSYFMVFLPVLHVVIFVILCSTTFVKPNTCFVSFTYMSDAQLSVLCISQGTYTIHEYLRNYTTYPGLGIRYQHHTILNHVAYRHMPYYILFVAGLFRLPLLLWNKIESGSVTLILENLRLHRRLLSTDDFGRIVQEHLTSGRTNGLTFYILLCTIWNFVNVCLASFIFDTLYNDLFTPLGIAQMQYLQQDTPGISPLEAAFPFMTQCEIDEVGPSGSVQHRVAACTLSLNTFLREGLLLLWILYAIGIIVTLFTIAHFLLQMNCIDWRISKLKSHCTSKDLDIKWICLKSPLNHFSFLDLLLPRLPAHHAITILRYLSKHYVRNNVR